MIVGLLIGSLLVANSAPFLAGLFVFGVGWTPSWRNSNNVSRFPPPWTVEQIPGGYKV